MPRQYSPEVRRQVIELARAGTKLKQLARTFEMSDATIYNWLKLERIDCGEAEGASTSQQLELAADRQRIRHAAADQAQRAAELETLTRRELALVGQILTATGNAGRAAPDAEAAAAARAASRPAASPGRWVRLLRQPRIAESSRASKSRSIRFPVVMTQRRLLSQTEEGRIAVLTVWGDRPRRDRAPDPRRARTGYPAMRSLIRSSRSPRTPRGPKR